jgi:hypothetical protein
VRSINVQMYVGELQLGDCIRDTFLIDWSGCRTERDALVCDGVTQGVRFENDGEVKILGSRN